MSNLQGKFNIIGHTSPTPIFQVASATTAGTRTVDAIGPAKKYPVVNLNTDGSVPPYNITGLVPGAPGAAGLFYYYVKLADGSLLESGEFVPVETSPGIVDLNILATAGLAQVATPAQLTALNTMLSNGNLLLPQLSQALSDALAVIGVNSAYISETMSDPSLSAPDGTKGAKRDSTGGIVRLLKVGGVGTGSWTAIGSPVTSELRAAQIAYAIQNTINQLPDGQNPGYGRVWSSMPDAGLVPATIGDLNPWGGYGIRNPVGGWIAYATAVLPLPTDKSLRVWFLVKPVGSATLSGVSNFFRISATTDTGTYIKTWGGTTSSSTLIGTLSGYSVYEFLIPASDWATYAPDAAGYRAEINLNYGNSAYQLDVAGMILLPSAQTPPSSAQQVQSLTLSQQSAKAIDLWLTADRGFTAPGSTTKIDPMMANASQGIDADVTAYKVTGKLDLLRRALTMATSIIAQRDYERVRTLFDGTVNPKLWSTDQYQSPNGSLWQAVDTTNPPHPGVYTTFEYHTGQMIYPMLLAVEAAQAVTNLPTDMATMRDNVKQACLDAITALDSNYADSTHVTNTDPTNPLQTGEGRYFVRYSTSVSTALREGYSYVPGGTESPVNQNIMMAAALYVAYRVHKAAGYGAGAAQYKTKADSILKRFKRNLIAIDGMKVWSYYNPGIWPVTVWTTSTSGAPYASGWSSYANPSPASVAGEDYSHWLVVLRGVKECIKTSNVLSFDDISGIAQTFNAFYPTAYYQALARLPLVSSSAGTASTTQLPHPTLYQAAFLATYDNRIAGKLKRMYERGYFKASWSTPELMLHGIL